jgi:hypothetical protein
MFLDKSVLPLQIWSASLPIEHVSLWLAERPRPCRPFMIRSILPDGHSRRGLVADVDDLLRSVRPARAIQRREAPRKAWRRQAPRLAGDTRELPEEPQRQHL